MFGPSTPPDKITDDRWLANQLVAFGAEPRWPFDALVKRQQLAMANKWAPEPGNIRADLSAGSTKIPAYYFRGTSDKRAMIIGGVHGSEPAGVEVVNMLLDIMRAPGAKMPKYSVIIVPSLFPKNLAARSRKTSDTATDPNRQMPAVGSAPGTKDSEGRTIEAENLVLLDLVERFRPERLASVHGHSVPEKPTADQPGITTDPRPGKEATDDALALAMAKAAAAGGARVPGNKLGEKGQTTRYPTSTAAHEKGVTFGDYGSHDAGKRPAMNMILIETFGNATTGDIKDAKQKAARKVELESLAKVLRDIFLEKD
jgi:hypothetical protein